MVCEQWLSFVQSGTIHDLCLRWRTKDVAEENVYDAVTIEDDTKIYDDVVSIRNRLKVGEWWNKEEWDEKLCSKE